MESQTLGPSQGGVVSPLLANVELNFLNWQQDELGLRFVRYTDDFVLFCRTSHQAKEARDVVKPFPK